MNIEQERELFEEVNPNAKLVEWVGSMPDKYGNFNIYLDSDTQIKFAGFCQGLRAKVPSNHMAFILKHEKTGEIDVVSLSRGEIQSALSEVILDKLDCGCQPIGETNYTECDCQEWAEGFEILTPMNGE